MIPLRWCALLLCGLAASAAGCGNPCTHLSDQVCADVGPVDCQLWLSSENVSGDMLSWRDRRASTAVPVCEMWLAPANYQRATLPFVRWRIANERAPGRAGPPPQFGRLQPPEDALGLPGWAYYLIAPLAMAGALAYGLLAMRRARRAQASAKTWVPPQ